MPPWRQASSVNDEGSPILSRIVCTIFCIPLNENGLVIPSRTSLRIIGTPATRQPRKDRLCIFIEFHDPAICCFLKRMPNNGPGLVVLDLDRARPFLAGVVGPSQIARQDILRPLEPLKADDRCRASLRLPAFDATPSKSVDLLSRGCGLRPLRAPLLGHALPRVRNGAIELAWIQAMHDTPSPTTQRDSLLTLPRT